MDRRCGDGRRAGARPAPAQVRGNDWRAVDAPAAAAFEPREALSVVVPCFDARRELDLALAALERQTWPRDLVEVVVVDDGSEPPLEAPSGTPLAVRVIRQQRRGFGLARARNAGVRAARHDIVVFLDGDLLAGEELLAEHARWHHAVADAVTLGFTAYVDPDGVDAAAIRGHAGPLAALFAARPADPPWTERHMARTDDLTASRDDVFRAVVGNNLGIRRTLFDALGGFDESFDRYGWEDTEFGWRAQTRGALLVPARAAFAWHQGRFAPNRSRGKRRAVAAQAHNGAALIAHPDFRPEGGGWAVPRTAVTVEAAGSSAAQAAATVERLLAGDDRDLAVLVDAGAGRAGELRDVLRARFAADPRVRIAAGGSALDAFPATPFHVTLPAGAEVGTGLLHRLRSGLGRAAVGEAALPDGARARVARAWVLHRARRAGGCAAAYGTAVAFRMRWAGTARLGASALRRIPAVRRPLRGLFRLLAEALEVRGPGDAERFARWVLAGARWWLGARLGHGRRERRAGLLGMAVRPRQLAALAARRARCGRPADLVAAAGLALAVRPSADPYAASARHLALALGALPGGRLVDGLAGSLAGAARSATRSAAAAAIAAALAVGDRRAALSMARTAARAPDRQAEKIVSRRYRFVWIANPKVASRSLIRALRTADPEAALVREATLAEVHAAFPEAREYFSFAFVRHPVERALTCHADKVGGAGNVAVGAFHGLSAGMDLDAFCAWLATPWGSDAFADRHWLSQDILLREAPDAPLPDFLGRFEHLAEDFAAVTAGLGMPSPPLPHLNRGPGAAGPASPDALAALARRYARDFALFGYAQPCSGARP